MASKLLRKTELLFWDHAIPEMSENERLQTWIRSLPRSEYPDRSKSTKVLYTFLAVCGFIFGILTFVLTHST